MTTPPRYTCHRCGRSHQTPSISQDGIHTCIVCLAGDRARGRTNWNLSGEAPFLRGSQEEERNWWKEIKKKSKDNANHKTAIKPKRKMKASS